MQRSFGFDPGSLPRVLCAVGWGVLACPRCGGRLGLVALIQEAPVIRRILGHLGLPTEVPTASPARPPPIPFEPFDHFDHYIGDDIAVP
jgi:hypothetical protein